MKKTITTLFFIGILATGLLSQFEGTFKDYQYLEDLYIDLHQTPELSFLEKETSAKMANELRVLGFDVTENFGGYGVVGVLKNGDGPRVLLRADTDALPVLEETGLPFASKKRMVDITGFEVPVMHACGHDMHMTVWVGTARFMAKNQDLWRGTLVAIAQPAEERSGGAKAMLADGLYEKFGVPDYALALHVSASLPAGSVGIPSGFSMANVDMMKIVIKGKGGHGAYPHTTIDPVVMAARLILDLQTLASREISPLQPAVVTVGSISGGTKGNVIPNEVVLELTMRSYTDEVRDQIINGIKRKCNALGYSAGLPKDLYPEVILHDEYTPALYNDPELVDRLKPAMKKAIGDSNVLDYDPVMGGEDFGRFGRTEEKVPITLFWLGAVDPSVYTNALENGEVLPSLHSSKFAPDKSRSIPTGVKAMSSGLLELMGRD